MCQPPTAVSRARQRLAARAVSLFAALMAAVSCPVSACGAQAQDKPLPEFPVIEKTVKEHFAKLPGYKPHDILTRRDVAPLFAKLEKQGWKAADSAAIVDRLLTENDSLVRELRSRGGKPFMRKIGSLPGGYDRLDRMRKMPYGQRRVRELIRDPGGWTMIAYMTTTPNGRNLNRQVAQGRNGKNFDRSTGRLYSAKDVLEQLKKSHEAERKRRKATQVSRNTDGWHGRLVRPCFDATRIQSAAAVLLSLMSLCSTTVARRIEERIIRRPGKQEFAEFELLPNNDCRSSSIEKARLPREKPGSLYPTNW